MTWDARTEWGVIPLNQPVRELWFHFTKPPYALMHNFTQTPEIAERKWKFYRDCGRMTDGQQPVYEIFGPAVPLESWMK